MKIDQATYQSGCICLLVWQRGGGQIIKLHVNWYTKQSINQEAVLQKQIVLKFRNSTWLCQMTHTSFYLYYLFRLMCPVYFFFLSNLYNWCKTALNIYCFSSYCVLISLLSLFRLFPCYESFYILDVTLFESLVNTISDASSDMTCCL